MYPYFCLVAAMVLVGSSVVAGKVLTDTVPVFLGSALRFGIALAVLLPLVRLREGGLPRLSRRSWALLGLQSLFGSFLFTVFLLFGLRHTGPGAAGVITSATPACMGLFSWLFLHERLGWLRVLGITCTVSGVAVLNVLSAGHGDGNALMDGGALWGNVLVLGAVVAESLFLLIRKGVHEPLSPLAASTVVSLGGLAWFAPIALWEAVTCDLAAIPASGWVAVVYYGLLVTVAAYLFWFAGIVRVDGAVAGVFTAIMPASAIMLSWVVLGIAPAPGVVWGGAGVLAGILVMARAGARADNGNGKTARAGVLKRTRCGPSGFEPVEGKPVRKC